MTAYAAARIVPTTAGTVTGARISGTLAEVLARVAAERPAAVFVGNGAARPLDAEQASALAQCDGNAGADAWAYLCPSLNGPYIGIVHTVAGILYYLRRR